MLCNVEVEIEIEEDGLYLGFKTRRVAPISLQKTRVINP